MIDKVLVCDDEFMIRDVLVETLSRHGVEVITAANGEEAMKLADKHDFQLIFCDFKMGKANGMDVLKHYRAKSPASLFVLMTAYGTVETAVEAIKLGAYDFILKPFSPDQTDVIFEKATRWLQMNSERQYLANELAARTGGVTAGGKELLGKSLAMQEVMKLVRKVARSRVTVLVTGESGTGKEMVASAIEAAANPERKAPYIRLNCAAVPENLIESELFGHEKGAFTGASERRVGRFELADGGTLLLDEIGEIPLAMQSKLLRVLQESEFERVGGNRTVKVDVRIIASTNRDLRKEVDEGRFREDLYYRLNVIPIQVPPLRERAGDIEILAKSMLEKAARRAGRPLSFSRSALAALADFAWPGNVRELENMIERLSVLEDGPEIGAEALPSSLMKGRPVAQPHSPSSSAPQASSATSSFNLHDLERDTIKLALRHTKGQKTRAADLLGFTPRTLRNKLDEYRKSGEWDADQEFGNND
jgi:DNA-binding NtrC family response regulator